MTGVEIVHATGTRAVNAYEMPTWQRSYAITARVTRGNNTHTILGDRRENPSELPLNLEVEAATLPGAYVLAYSIVEEAETAEVVRFHWGHVIVDGVLGASITPVSATSVRVGLRFHPASGAAVTPGVNPTADSTSVTADSALFTADNA